MKKIKKECSKENILFMYRSVFGAGLLIWESDYLGSMIQGTSADVRIRQHK